MSAMCTSARRTTDGTHHNILCHFCPLFIGGIAALSDDLPTTTRGNRWPIMDVICVSHKTVARPPPHTTVENVIPFTNEEIVAHCSAPVENLSGRGSQYRVKVVAEYLNVLQTKQTFTSAYYPQKNFTVERWNKTLRNVLTKFTSEATR